MSLLERWPYSRDNFVNVSMYVAGTVGSVLIREVSLFLSFLYPCLCCWEGGCVRLPFTRVRSTCLMLAKPDWACLAPLSPHTVLRSGGLGCLPVLRSQSTFRIVVCYVRLRVYSTRWYISFLNG